MTLSRRLLVLAMALMAGVTHLALAQTEAESAPVPVPANFDTVAAIREFRLKLENAPQPEAPQKAADDGIQEHAIKLRDHAMKSTTRQSNINALDQLEYEFSMDSSESLVRLANLGDLRLEGELRDEWLRLKQVIHGHEEDRQQRELETWNREVDEFVKAAHDACLNAKSSAELDALLLRGDGLSKGDSRAYSARSGSLAQRINYKLEGTISALQSWGRFLDQARAGQPKTANTILRGLGKGRESFPLLSQEEIDARLLPEPVESEDQNYEENLTKLLAEAKEPADLPGYIERLREFTKEPQLTNRDYFRRELQAAEQVLGVWETAQRGDLDGAQHGLRNFATTDRPASGPLYQRVREASLQKLVSDKLAAFGFSPTAPDQPVEAQIEEALLGLKSAEKYQEMLDLMEFAQKLPPENPQTSRESYTQERSATQYYLAAQRFVEVADLRMAVFKLREVVAMEGVKFAPQEKATAQLKDLLHKNPLLAAENELTLLNELNALRTEIRQLRSTVIRPDTPVAQISPDARTDSRSPGTFPASVARPGARHFGGGVAGGL